MQTLWIRTCIVGLIVGPLFHYSSASAAAAPPALSKPDPGTDKAEQRFQRTVAAMASIRSAARNPDSVVWESAHADASGNVVCITYRAQNGFGGMNRGIAVLHGTSFNDKVSHWNKFCGAATFDTFYARRALE